MVSHRPQTHHEPHVLVAHALLALSERSIKNMADVTVADDGKLSKK